eukprot:gene2118-5158_t
MSNNSLPSQSYPAASIKDVDNQQTRSRHHEQADIEYSSSHNNSDQNESEMFDPVKFLSKESDILMRPQRYSYEEDDNNNNNKQQRLMRRHFPAQATLDDGRASSISSSKGEVFLDHDPGDSSKTSHVHKRLQSQSCTKIDVATQDRNRDILQGGNETPHSLLRGNVSVPFETKQPSRHRTPVASTSDSEQAALSNASPALQQASARGDTLMTLEALAHTLRDPNPARWSARGRHGSGSRVRRHRRSKSLVDRKNRTDHCDTDRTTYVSTLPYVPPDSVSSSGCKSSSRGSLYGSDKQIVTLMVIAMEKKVMASPMQANNIPVPPHVILDRTNGKSPRVIEKEDVLEIDGETITKPFVMKPIDAEDHNIYVYFSQHDGGGAQHLFRKRKDRASEFIPDKCDIPAEGSFVFEKFLTTGGTDIKVYTVGPNYAHAEGRKAPVVDGKVLRDQRGKELRCPILLTAFEKEIAKKVVQAFKQNICGFDLLRTQEHKSYVCDVNGWSFVKRSPHYFDDCARIIRSMVLNACAPQLHDNTLAIERPKPLVQKIGHKRTWEGAENAELRCVIALIRHGDRTPKEKLKLTTSLPEILGLYARWAENKSKPKEIKLKTRVQLEDALSCIQKVLKKVTVPEETRQALSKVEQVLTRWPISGINRKLQLKPMLSKETDKAGHSVIGIKMVMKWGGELTPSGLHQAKQAGTDFRELMYPRTSEMNGLLRLHSTYRHDLKLYSSDEGRVQMTAAAFAKGLLQLHGEITPILVSLVRKDQAVNMLLDETKAARADMDRVKHTISELLLERDNWDSAKANLVPASVRESLSSSVSKQLNSIVSGRAAMSELYEHLTKMVEELDQMISIRPSLVVYRSEPVSLLQRRWHKLQEEFYDAKHDEFVVSKIPDIYDSVKYMVTHNHHLDLRSTDTVFRLSRTLADVVVPQEYGITRQEKITIGKNICGQLFRKMVHDLRVAAGKETTHQVFQHEVSHRLDSERDSFIHVRTPDRNVRTRLYFTSESHIHSMLNVMRCGDYGLFGHTWIQEHQRQARESRHGTSVDDNDDEDDTDNDHDDNEENLRSNNDAEGSFLPDNLKKLIQDGITHEGTGQARQDENSTHESDDSSDLDDSDHENFMYDGQDIGGVTEFKTLPLAPGSSCGFPVWQTGMRYLSETPELNYLSQIVCRLFERSDVPEDDTNRFFVEWIVSNGTPPVEYNPKNQRPMSPTSSSEGDIEDGPPITPYVVLHPGLPLQCIEAFFRQYFPDTVEAPGSNDSEAQTK